MLARATVLVALAGCLRTTAYQCSDDQQCGTGNTCEATSYCSQPDESCGPGGDRYVESAGPHAGKCVGADVTPVDAPVADAPPNTQCPPPFAPLPGSGGTHWYKLLDADDWDAARRACNDGSDGYLAIPGDAAELAALAAASPTAWLGIIEINNLYWNTLGAVQQFLPWGPSQPTSDDCVRIETLTTIRTERCDMQLPVICECDPD